MSLSQYLFPRGARGIWQLRVPVPRAYQAKHNVASPRAQSLGTADRRAAEKLAMPLIAQWRAEWYDDAAPVKAGARTDLSQLAVNRAYRGLMDSLDTHRRASPNRHSVSYVERREQDKVRLTQQLLDGELGTFETLADRFLANDQIDVPKDTPEYVDFVRTVGESVIAALDVKARQLRGELDAEPRSKAVRSTLARQEATAPAGKTLSELYDAYIDWRTNPQRTRRRRRELFEQDRVVIELFAEFIGRDRAVSSITKDDARSFRRMLATFPASRGKKKGMSRLTIAECVAAAKRDALPTLSLKTQAKYLSILSPFFAWLVSEGEGGLETNIWDGLHHQIERGENRRPSLSHEQLQTLVSSPLFNACRGEVRCHYDRSRRR